MQIFPSAETKLSCEISDRSFLQSRLALPHGSRLGFVIQVHLSCLGWATRLRVTESFLWTFRRRLLMPCKKKYRWQKTYDSVLHESDPAKRLPLIERTVAELERRFAELGDDPATALELNAIFKAISTLRRRLSRMQQTNLR